MSRTVLLNYADRNFRTAQQLNTRSGLETGGFDRVINLGPSDLPREFRRQHHSILQRPRGGGYFLWKPYIISRALAQLSAGDWLFYCDSGAYFIDAIHPLKDAYASGLPVMVFELEHTEKVWTKRDVFIATNTDVPAVTDTVQRSATASLWRVGAPAIHLAKEWLSFAVQESLLCDGPNLLGYPDYPGFIEHRYDQSLLSVLTKRLGLPALRDVSQYGNHALGIRKDSPYPQLIVSTRQRDRPWHRRLRRSLKKYILPR